MEIPIRLTKKWIYSLSRNQLIEAIIEARALHEVALGSSRVKEVTVSRRRLNLLIDVFASRFPKKEE